MVNNVVLPFLMSMLLGRTIDLTSYTISGNVYDDAEFDETQVNSINSTYHVLQDGVLPYRFFGLPTDIVLRIKSGFLSSRSGTMGLDGILKDTSWKYNSVIVSVTTVSRTVDRTLKKTAELLPDWSAKIPLSQTHYAKSLMYGGWSVVLFRFQCDIPADVQAVRKVVTKHLGDFGDFSNDTLGKWESAMEEINEDEGIRGSVQIKTHVYSTVPLKDSIDSPKNMLDAIENFQENVGPLGQPMLMDLNPLNALDNKFPVVEENIELLSELEKLDQMFDDVKTTKVSMMRWITESTTLFEDDQEVQIYKLLNVLNLCIKAFSRVGSEVSLFKSMNREILDSAYQMYLGKLEKGIANYNLAFRRLKEEIDAGCENTFLHKIRGLLRVYDHEVKKKGKVTDLQECQKLCTVDERCRSIGYALHFSELDLATGLYFKKEKQCWIYMRSTSTATVHTPNGLSGDLAVYDRKCY